MENGENSLVHPSSVTVLVIGDEGCGKSSLIQSLSAIADQPDKIDEDFVMDTAPPRFNSFPLSLTDDCLFTMRDVPALTRTHATLQVSGISLDDVNQRIG